MYMDKKVFIFDVDGTLTEPRQPMDVEMIPVLERFISERTVFLATGSDYAKVLQQIPKNIIDDCMGIFTCMGNELRVADEVIYSNKLKLPADVINWLYDQLKRSTYPKSKSGTQNFEYRAGMLNFSIVGRDIDTELRKQYSSWDKVHSQRSSIAEDFNRYFSKYNLRAVIGGEVSIDIQEKDKDKAQVYHYLSMYNTKVFFGDKCYPGGNDNSLYNLCEEKFAVDSPYDTFNIIDLILKGKIVI